MSAEVWKLVAVLVFFAIVLAVSHWFVILPDRVTRRLDKLGQYRQGYARDERWALHERHLMPCQADRTILEKSQPNGDGGALEM